MNIFYSEFILAPLPTEINSHQGLNCFQIVPLALNNANKVLAEGGGDALSRLVKLLKSQSILNSQHNHQPAIDLLFFFFDEKKSEHLTRQIFF